MTEPYYACEQPERLPERGLTFFHTQRPCRGCALAAEAAYRMDPDHVNDVGISAAEIVARTRRALDA